MLTWIPHCPIRACQLSFLSFFFLAPPNYCLLCAWILFVGLYNSNLIHVTKYCGQRDFLGFMVYLIDEIFWTLSVVLLGYILFLWVFSLFDLAILLVAAIVYNMRKCLLILCYAILIHQIPYSSTKLHK